MFTCTVCNEDKETPKGYGEAGYGVDKDGNKVCYACCGEQDKKYMEENNKTIQYLRWEDRKPTEIGDWPGTMGFKIRYAFRGNHNWGITRWDVYFKDHVGAWWWGVNLGDNDVVRCKKLKVAPRWLPVYYH